MKQRHKRKIAKDGTLENATLNRYNGTMTSPSENLPAPERVIEPCLLIFLGIIFCAVGFYVDSFDIINDFVGMLLFLWGVVSLFRIPISRRYQRQMAFIVVVAILSTIIAFYGGILVPFFPALMPPPSNIVFALFFLCAFVSLISMLIFFRCMKEYCTVMNWERPLASWKFSTKITTYGVLIPFAILAIPTYIGFTTLEFHPKKPPKIDWKTEWIYNEDRRLTAVQYTARRDGNVIHSEVVPFPSEGSFSHTYPKVDPSPSDGPRIDFGDWFAPIKGWFAGTIVWLNMLLLLLFGFGAVIHFLMSLSRMIYAAQKLLTEPECNAI